MNRQYTKSDIIDAVLRVRQLEIDNCNLYCLNNPDNTSERLHDKSVALGILQAVLHEISQIKP